MNERYDSDWMVLKFTFRQTIHMNMEMCLSLDFVRRSPVSHHRLLYKWQTKFILDSYLKCPEHMKLATIFFFSSFSLNKSWIVCRLLYDDMNEMIIVRARIPGNISRNIRMIKMQCMYVQWMGHFFFFCK